MRITTWNVNGLRAAIRKGFQQHLERIAPDVLLLQEIRCQPEQLPVEFRQPDGWSVIWNPARRPGYSGTAIWSRWPIQLLQMDLGNGRLDGEGRLIHARIGELDVAAVYLPSGSSGAERQAVKDQWLTRFQRWAAGHQSGRPMVFGGDLNIAHTEQDIFYAKANEQTSGFLPHERRWISRLLESGWSDLVREHAGDVQGPYSWWSNRGRARELDRGWRIDYVLSNPAARPLVHAASIDRAGGLEVSDHAPVSVDVEL